MEEGIVRAALAQAREEITEIVADRTPLRFPLRRALFHAWHIKLVKDSRVCLKSQKVPVLQTNGCKRVMSQLEMQHHTRSINVCPFPIHNRAPDQHEFIGGERSSDGITKPDMVAFRIADCCDRLQPAKERRVKASNTVGYRPFVKCAQPGKVIALICGVHPVSQESSRESLRQMPPVKRPLLPRSEPPSETLKHPKVVRHGSWLLPRQPVSQIEFHAVDCPNSENGGLFQGRPTKDQKLAAID